MSDGTWDQYLQSEVEFELEKVVESCVEHSLAVKHAKQLFKQSEIKSFGT